MRIKYRKALTRRQRRHVKVRARVSGTAVRPRLCVFRSSAHIYAQVIDDQQGHTLVSASDIEEAVRERAGDKATKSDRARIVGEVVGERAKEAGIESVVFDRGGFLFHGRVKAVADGAREAGLQF
ncbi:MAG: 50S ribosomal protein L18 [Thermomicrobiales bacterium]|nr:50S ribosomal protein L18 [Thermomicrobiales bacterium]MCC6943269.1 50S ribosomal protein L18 [Thermomicrobiales bacterium]